MRVLATWLSPAMATLAVAAAPPNDTLYLKAERVIVRPGEVLEGAAVLVAGGRIQAVGIGIEKPEGALEINGHTVCAGFIDVWSAIGVEPDTLGDLRTTPASRTADAVDLYAGANLRKEALRAGVTCVRAQGGVRAEVGGVGVVLRLHPEIGVVEELLLPDATVAMAAGLSQLGSQRAQQAEDGSVEVTPGAMEAVDPFDRLGQVDKVGSAVESGRKYLEDKIEYRYELEEWEKTIAESTAKLEKDFKKAAKDREKEVKEAEEKGKEFKEKAYKEDKKPKPPKHDDDKEVLARVANGELPLVVEVHRVAELRALLESTRPFDRLRLVIAGGTEATFVAKELAERSIPVIVWPALRGTSDLDEYAAHDLELAAELHSAGVSVLLGSGGRSPEATRDLPLLAAVAVGHGLDREAAFAALTLEAARTLDVADRIGSVERGKDADLLVLDGEPLATTTHVRYVVSGGTLVVTPEDR